MTSDRRAVHSSTLEHEPGRHAGGACEWRCVSCGERLAIGADGRLIVDGGRASIRGLPRGDAVLLRSDLRLRPGVRDGLRAFGLPNRIRLGSTALRDVDRVGWAAKGELLPIVAYCPRRECGTGQVLA